MPETLCSAVVPAPAERVWPVVRDFDGLPAWHPAIASSRLRDGDAGDRVGAVRTLALADGATVVEQLVALDDVSRSVTYEIRESPFPVGLYRSTIRVVPVTEGGETFVEWSVVFDCDRSDAQRLIALFRDDVYGVGLRGLRETVSGT